MCLYLCGTKILVSSEEYQRKHIKLRNVYRYDKYIIRNLAMKIQMLGDVRTQKGRVQINDAIPIALYWITRSLRHV